MGVRGSTWSRDFIVGAGGPGGVRLPWAKPERGTTKHTKYTKNFNAARLSKILVNDGLFMAFPFVCFAYFVVSAQFSVVEVSPGIRFFAQVEIRIGRAEVL